MNTDYISKATLGRLPIYLQYLRSVRMEKRSISATGIANALGFGEVQVRKDLGSICKRGKPKIGYVTEELIAELEMCLRCDSKGQAIIVGAGKLGQALLDYAGFSEYGLEIIAAFDSRVQNGECSEKGKPIYPFREIGGFCYRNDVHIGIITVPKEAAQEVCNEMVKNNICAIWSFAPIILTVPDHVVVMQENLALSLAHLKKQIK